MGYRGREQSEESSGNLSAECRGWELRDREGEKIGKVDEVFVDNNDHPEYLGSKTGLLGSRLTLIPADLAQADEERGLIQLSESKDHIKGAPSLGSNEEITSEREREIRDYFGLDSSSSESEARRGRDGDTSEISPGYRQDSGNDRETRPADETESSTQRPDSGDEEHNERNSTESREPWADSGDSGGHGEAGDHSSVSEEARGASVRNDREGDRMGGEPSQSRGGASDGGKRETMRVTLWREKARAEKVIGEDGSEEVRIRKEWVEDEENVEVEDRRQR